MEDGEQLLLRQLIVFESFHCDQCADGEKTDIDEDVQGGNAADDREGSPRIPKW